MLRGFLMFTTIIVMLQTQSFANKILTAYIEEYKLVAVGEMKKSGIPASIKLAQGILESDMGRSDMARMANNHFGIKCGKDWTGKTFYKLDDDRDTTGALVESCFRAYEIPSLSYAAHTSFLTNPGKTSRYGFLFDLPITDYVGWANGLKSAGYASDPAYPTKLIKIIEDNKLHLLDMGFTPIKRDKDIPIVKEETKAKETKKSSEPTMKKEKDDVIASTKEKKNKSEIPARKEPEVIAEKVKYTSINGTSVIYARRGETITSLAKRTGHDTYRLLYYNEGIVSPHEPLDDETVIFTARKKKSATTEFHLVKSGETLFEISQKYGVRLESLCIKNNIKPDAMVKAGERVSLIKHLSIKNTPKHNFLPRFDRYLDMNETK